MDKNKSRTDLLAAGRKKLQQFRQKKDHKGSSSHGKSSKKSTKSEQHESDVDAASAAAKSTASSLPEGESTSRVASDLGAVDSNVVENSLASEVAVAAVNPPSVATTPEHHRAELPLQQLGVGDADSAFKEKEDDQTVHAEERESTATKASAIPASEKETDHTDKPATDDVSAPSASFDTTEAGTATLKTDNVDMKENLGLEPSEEVMPNASLMEAKGDQVTAIGAMQEADDLGLKQVDRSNEVDLVQDEKFEGSVASINESVSGPTGVSGSIHETEPIIEVNKVSASAIAVGLSDGISSPAVDVLEADGSLPVDHHVLNQPDYMVAGLPNEEKSELLSTDNGNTRSHEDIKVVSEADDRSFPEDPLLTEDKKSLETELPSSSIELTMSSVGDGCSISLSQLKEAVKQLDEDEFKSLCNSREKVSDVAMGGGSLTRPEFGLQDYLQRLTDELYLTNFNKDIFHLQLTEMTHQQMECDHQRNQFVDENYLLRESLKEVQERKESLVQELSDYREESQTVTGRVEEFENQVHSLKAEAEKFSARAHELQISLERSQEDASTLSMELSDCKGLVASLQLENENLKGTLALAMDDKKKLVEEKVSYLNESEKLSSELADCKSFITALEAENSSLRGTLGLVTEERVKLEEEKQSLASDNEKISMELANCNNLISALQIENANQSMSLALVVDEKKKLEEEKEILVEDNVMLSSELLVFHENLKEFTLRLEQLNEENNILSSSLDIYKTKIWEIEDKEARTNTGVLVSEQVESSQVEIGSRENAINDQKYHQIPGKQDGEISSSLLQKASSDEPVLRWGFEEAEEVMRTLEKAIDRMHTESASLRRASSKVSAPAVSKLIQAFESKVQHDELEADENPLVEAMSPTDPFMSTKEQIGKLRAVLQQLGLSVGNAEEKRVVSDARFREVKLEQEALERYSDCLEAENLELHVLYEAVKQHTAGMEAKNNELEVLYKALEEQDYKLKAEYGKLGEKASEYKSRVSELLNQLQNLQQSSDEKASVIDEKASVIEYQLRSLQKEATERVSILEEEWNSTTAQILEAVGRLDKYNGRSSTAGTDDDLNIYNHIAASVDATIKKIEDLQETLVASRADYETTCNSYSEVNEKFNDLLMRNELASSVLHKIYGDLRKLLIDSCGSGDNPEINIPAGELPDPFDYNMFKTILEQLENFLAERLQLQSLNNELNLDILSRAKDLDELNRSCLNSNAIQKLVQDVEGLLELEDIEIDLEESPASRLESLVSLLAQRYKEAGKQVSLSQQDIGSKVIELEELQEKIHELNALNLRHEDEIATLRESLSQTEEALTGARSELQEKIGEIEQSDQRVSSIREKLSIAVAKGKGLIGQRDSLKQSLTETSKELERCSEELHLKDAWLHELEMKLKTYMEAGERVEALESELSYIRNSATALRESFLLKDSVLQRIEEILEDLDLPEHFHSRDIIEKIDWLARSATANPLPPSDLDQKSSVKGYSDAGFVVTDGWKEDPPLSSTSGDDLRRKYEELQNKFYGLAEQNEMLEQSLVERNHLVQRWEELLERINMPSHMRSVEPEDRIKWLGTAILEANSDRDSLQQQIADLENYHGLLTADFEESKKRISDLEAELQVVIHERECISERLDVMISDRDKVLANAVQLEEDNEKLKNEVTNLQENLAQKVGNEESIYSIEGEIHRLEDLVRDALSFEASSSEDLVSGESITKCLEALLMKLLKNYSTLSSVKPVVCGTIDVHQVEDADAGLHEPGSRALPVTEGPDVAVLKKDLDEALLDLMHIKEERNEYMEKQKSLVSEVEALEKKTGELQELLTQEEQRSVSLREKLNVAVRKGKSVVQQRDTLKQSLDEMNNELEHLKSTISGKENAIAEYELKLRDLSIYPEMVKTLESEKLTLKNRLMDAEDILHQREHTLNGIAQALADIDIDLEVTVSDPIEKLHQIEKLCRDLNAALSSSENESRKSRRAAELLLAELNEVQERNDAFQEELAKASCELSELTKERDAAEVAKLEALSRLEKFSVVCSEGKQKQYSEMMVLQSGVKQLRKGFSDINSLVADFFYKDLEFLHNLETYVESCLKQKDVVDVVDMPILRAYGGITAHNSESKESILAMDSWTVPGASDSFDDSVLFEISSSIRSSMQDFKMEIDALENKMRKLSVALQDKASTLANVMEILGRDVTSHKRSFEALKREMSRAESVEKERDAEVVLLRQNIGLLFKACSNAVEEIERRKAELVGNNLVVGDISFNGQTLFTSEEHIKTIADRLLLTLKDFAFTKSDIMEGGLKEMRITIANLQRELQEKDAQKDRICTELVSQIKAAEAAAQSHLLDLQSSKAQVYGMEQEIKMLQEERRSMEVRAKELQDEQVVVTELQEKVRSLSNVVAAKDQEIEALMQALDEEENQMEEFKNRIEGLEKVVRQKNLDLENLEASRGKISKRLSITVNKFDELHQLSESLIAEVEKLQSQLQDRDAEISFLRQEVTRCTNEVLVASQMSNSRDADDILELLAWIDSTFSQIGVHDVHLDVKESSQVSEYREILQKKVSAIISELENLHTVVQNRDALLQVEKNKVQELKQKEEILLNSLREKESQLNMLEGVEDSGRATSSTSEIIEVEPVINKWTVPGPSTTSQVRSLRKGGNDQVAIAIDMEPGNGSRLEDEDDDKVHGFKSLSTSRIVPRFTRRLTDMVDGLWVSCDRALMRQPALRLAIIFYWAVLHTLLASFVV